MFFVALDLIAILVILTLLVRWLEPRFAFFPAAGETVTPREFGVEYEAVVIATPDGERLGGWMMPLRAPRAHIVYCHGNGGNLSVWAPILTEIVRHGYSVLAFDYRGYGTSTGRPSEGGLYRDVDALIAWFEAWFEKRSPPQAPVVYWGRSLGAAMAAYAATIQAPDGLILESGFPDVPSLVRASPVLAFLALFSTYRFPCADFLRSVDVPVLVIHGDGDGIIPIAQGRKLFDRVVGPKQFVTIRHGDHNDVTPRDPHLYWEGVDRFVDSLKPTRARPAIAQDADGSRASG